MGLFYSKDDATSSSMITHVSTPLPRRKKKILEFPGLDPRSITEKIVRTPIQVEASVSESLIESESFDVDLRDPRSPTQVFHRTPLQFDGEAASPILQKTPENLKPLSADWPLTNAVAKKLDADWSLFDDVINKPSVDWPLEKNALSDWLPVQSTPVGSPQHFFNQENITPTKVTDRAANAQKTLVPRSPLQTISAAKVVTPTGSPLIRDVLRKNRRERLYASSAPPKSPVTLRV